MVRPVKNVVPVSAPVAPAVPAVPAVETPVVPADVVVKVESAVEKVEKQLGKKPRKPRETASKEPPANLVVVSDEVPVVASSTATVVPAVSEVSADVPVVPSSEVEKTLDVEKNLDVSTQSVAFKMNEFNTKLLMLVNLFSTIKVQFKNLEKAVNKELKAFQKATTKKNRRSGNRQPSGFVRPTLISEELAAFLGKPAGSEMARTVVSKEINHYIRSNNLQDKSNGRKINADEKLAALLKLKEGDVLTYFNLQKYMKHHFVKVALPETA